MMKLIKICTCLLVVVVAWQATAQEKKKDTKGPLPAHYGKLGLSDEQKDGIYKVQDEYRSQIDTLAAQIKKLQAERDSKLEEKLSATQKTRLKELRDEAAAKAAKKKAESEAKSKEETTKASGSKSDEPKKP